MTNEEGGTDELDHRLCPKFSIFVDANILIPMLCNKDGAGLELLNLLSKAGNARLLTTDITRIEVAKNLAEDDCKIISPIEKVDFRERMKKMLNIPLSRVNMRELFLQAYERHTENVEYETSRNHWDCLKSNETVLSDIFMQYGEKRGLFSSETKKHQFADAIVFELLKNEAANDMPVFIYSRDKDFVEVARETENFEYANSLDELLKLLGLGMNEDVREAEGLIEGYRDDIAKWVSETLDHVSERYIKVVGYGYQTRTREYIRRVEVESYRSIRCEDHVLVTGKVTIRAQLPPECPSTYMLWWDVVEGRNATAMLETTDVICEVNVLVKMRDYGNFGIIRDDGKKVLEGTLHLEIETGPGGYNIIRAIWPKKEN